MATLSELLPNKWRHIGVVLADAAVLVAVIVAPVLARYGWEYGTWQWNFYTGAILQGLFVIGLFLLYFHLAHPYNLQPRELIKKLDYLGMRMAERVNSCPS
jgi:MFS family permease